MPESKPFPEMHAVAPPSANPHGFREFTLPAQQAAFDAFAYEKGLLRDGTRRWKNIDERNRVTLTFHLEIPPHLRGQKLHFKDADDKSRDRWPSSERAVRIVVKAGATCTLPDLWSSAILLVKDGQILGGMAPASMRPVDGGAFELHDGLVHLTPEPPEAA